VALPFEPPDSVINKDKSIEPTAEKEAIAESCGENKLARTVRPLEHTGETGIGRGNVPSKHATSDAAIVPVPVTCMPRSENKSPIINSPPGSTVTLKAMPNDLVSDEPAKNGDPNRPLFNRLNSKPAVSGELSGVGNRMRVPIEEVAEELELKSVINLSPTSQPLG